jgi:hypothetical protein
MFKVRRRLGIIIIVLLCISIGILVFVTIAAASGWEVLNLPPFDRPDKGNPKLDSQLNQLVRAERLGEAESFAEQSNIELIEGSVRVIIECVPNQVDNATIAANNAGATIEMDYDDLLQVVVPITSLTALTDAESIRFIRLPQYPTPGATKAD